MDESPTHSARDIQDASVFVARMLPFLADGLSWEAAGRAVLARDEQLRAALLASPEARAQLAREVWTRVRSRRS